ncbi:MAG: tetratricopeptide repeat protein [Candidatus Methanoperedens sp.]
MEILDSQCGEHFVGRDCELQELKKKIRTNRVTILTGDRGIGKTNLMEVLEKFFEDYSECHYIDYGSLFSKEMSDIFSKQTITYILGIPVLGVTPGINLKPRERSILNYMKESKEKIIFVGKAQDLKKEEIETIFAAKNDRLKFILEIATPYMRDVEIMDLSSDQIVKLNPLKEEYIEEILEIEFPNFSDSVAQRIIFLSKGNPYIAKTLGSICNKKTTEYEMVKFLKILKDEDIKNNLDRMHYEILKPLGQEGRDVINKLALAPQILTLNLIKAFCGEQIDIGLNDIIKRGMLKHENDLYKIYHPLFRDYLRSEQPIASNNMNKMYCKAMENIKSEFDSIYILLETLKEPDLFKELIKLSENYNALNSVGVQCYTWGRIDEANLSWSRILEIAESKDKEWESTAIGNMGKVYQIEGDLNTALKYFEKSLKLYEELGLKDGIASQFENIGNVNGIKGDLDEALKYFEKALKLYDGLKRKEGMASQFGNMGIVYQIKGDLDIALKYFEKSLELNEELEHKEGMANQFGNMGNVCRIKGDLDIALKYFVKSLELNEELGRKEGLALDFGNMGIVYRIKGDLDKALVYFEKSLELNAELGRKEGMANQFGNMGIIYRIKGELSRALECFGKALKLNEELGLKEGMANQFGNMGIVYGIKGDLDIALNYFENSLELNEELGRKGEVALDFGNMGDVYRIKEDLDKALWYYGKALKLNEELGRKEGIAIQFGNMGIVYQIKGDLNIALEYFEKALKLYDGLKCKEGMANQFENMGNVYGLKGDLDKALWYFGTSLKLFKEIGIKNEEARILVKIGNILVIKDKP